MMGDQQVVQDALFYEFSLERHVPGGHMLRAIDRFADLDVVRARLAPFYSSTGRPSVDPELLIRMLIVGYCFGIRSERRLCEEVHLNLAYRWFCRLGLEGDVPDHSPSPRTATAASGTATCCATSSRRWCAAVWRKGWSARGRGIERLGAGGVEPRDRRVHGRAGRCRVWSRDRGDPEVHLAGRSCGALDGRAGRSGLLRS